MFKNVYQMKNREELQKHMAEPSVIVLIRFIFVSVSRSAREL